MEKNILKRVASLALALVMVLSVLVVVDPKEVSAAAERNMKGSGTQYVEITDADIYNMAVANGGYYDDLYVKFKPTKTGYVTFKMSKLSDEYPFTEGEVTLCNSKKSPISTDDYFSSNSNESRYYTVTYGVEKGTQYYLKVYTKVGTKIKATFKSQSKSKYNSKGKAKNLGKDKEAKSIMIANKNKADWYKIKLNKSQQLKLTMGAKTNAATAKGGIKFSFYNSRGKLFTYNSFDYFSRAYKEDKNTVTYYMTKRGSSKKYCIPKGTYYVKVERANKTSSGYYTLKWK